jgi:hypothetical protein
MHPTYILKSGVVPELSAIRTALEVRTQLCWFVCPLRGWGLGAFVEGTTMHSV